MYQQDPGVVDQNLKSVPLWDQHPEDVSLNPMSFAALKKVPITIPGSQSFMGVV